ncbi:MAG: aldehyde ferredoxin oxidoreductase N-terminal domain-containing protein, partial [Desulfobacterales bacterium]|nr:aldehyde ferredoxin oxidoreductase N-terminal domain-containing protein [Desulfobacterales bacterium]
MKNAKMVTVHMTLGEITEAPVPERYELLGGRGLTSSMINDRVPADCDPLGEDNLLIFAPGFLSGTPLVNTGRLSIGAKSPLTGGIKESNAGGAMANALARFGIRAIIIEGQAPDKAWYHLVIDREGTASLVDARDCHQMGNYALAERLLNTYGSRNAIASIGPAGEMLLKSASIQTTSPDGIPSRAAARGGLGAVMGAKGLKAIVVSRQGKVARPIADAERFM